MLSDTLREDVLKLIFHGTAITDLAENDATAPLANLQVALHTAAPSADQEDKEVAYTSYARVAVARTSGGWTIANARATPAADVAFPASTGGADVVATHMSVGTDAAGAGKLLYAAKLSNPITIKNGGAAPTIAAGAEVQPVVNVAA